MERREGEGEGRNPARGRSPDCHRAGRRVDSMADAAEGSVEDMTGGAVLQCCQRVGSALQVKGMGGYGLVSGSDRFNWARGLDNFRYWADSIGLVG
ncbi:hypothetical protein ES332_A08G218800v1 [Gossypium tomentosum]|uniref:Uncharacterized protein n=1 Tax=Gossypium tomentosum TaxID=34277 RepID=A0A5D2PKS0_GOSTO|nr:hypothetical protein ES332_A08G218800v1 [Gossypium tomentosum]